MKKVRLRDLVISLQQIGNGRVRIWTHVNLFSSLGFIFLGYAFFIWEHTENMRQLHWNYAQESSNHLAKKEEALKPSVGLLIWWSSKWTSVMHIFESCFKIFTILLPPTPTTCTISMTTGSDNSNFAWTILSMLDKNSGRQVLLLSLFADEITDSTCVFRDGIFSYPSPYLLRPLSLRIAWMGRLWVQMWLEHIFLTMCPSLIEFLLLGLLVLWLFQRPGTRRWPQISSCLHSTR